MQAPPEIPTNASLGDGFRLGPLTIHPRAGEVTGPGGSEKLDPKVVDVLIELARRAGQVVSRDDLLARVWPNVVVTDEALSRCIYELRRQLSLAAGDERFKDVIETLPKRGYRLKDLVTHDVVERQVPPARKRMPLAIAGGALLVAILAGLLLLFRAQETPVPASAPATSIAVLPFVDMSPGKDQAYLADGIAEEILNRLAQSENLRVIARTSSFSFRDRPLDVGEIAKHLNVTHVLEGSVRKSGDRVRITAQLIAASDSSHVWSETFDRGLDDLFAVQDEIATSVTASLATRLPKGAPDSPSPSNFEAHEKFLQGEFFFNRRAPGDFQRAAEFYEAAVALDAGYAQAWAALAYAYSMLAGMSQPPDKALRLKQAQAALKAVEVDPNLAVAHIRLAQYYEYAQEDEKAEAHFERARVLDPADPFFLRHSIEKAIDSGNLGAAIALQRRILARDPLAAVELNDLAVYLLADGQLDDALAQFRSVQAIHPQTDPNVAIDILHVLLLQGRYDEAQAEIPLVPEGNQRNQGLALVYAATKRNAEADQATERMNENSNEIMDVVRLAEVYAYRNMADRAFTVLQGSKDRFATEHGRDSGHVWYLQFESRLSPFLRALHSDPRWSAFLSNSG